MKKLLALILFCNFVHAADNSVFIDQVGNNNVISITQDYVGNTATVDIGNLAPSDSNTVNITQQGPGTLNSLVDIKSGINNSITTNQVGTGNMTASVQNLNGSANSISISQYGSGNHTMNIIGAAGTTNNMDTVNTVQSGADKSFTLNLNGTNGATVTVQQTNPTISNTGSMTITCTSGNCGNYSYIRQ